MELMNSLSGLCFTMPCPLSCLLACPFCPVMLKVTSVGTDDPYSLDTFLGSPLPLAARGGPGRFWDRPLV